MRRTGNTIKLLLIRAESESDDVESDTKVVFQYISCQENCIYCNLDVDGEDGEKRRKRKAYPGNPIRTNPSKNKTPRTGADTVSGPTDTSAGLSTRSRFRTQPSTLQTTERIWIGAVIMIE